MTQDGADPLQALESRVRELENQVAQLWRQIQAGQQITQAPAPAQWTQPNPTGWAAPGWPQEYPWTAEARRIKAAGKPIVAIRLVREQTGWGLKEAKDYVDGL